MTSLFKPLNLGNLTLPHRIIMAPLTRSRASQPGNVPNEMNVEYYRQRASGGLIISEATQISQQGQGYAWTPGIHSDEQIDGWRKIANAVHAEGGKMFMQLWHVGRVSHPSFQPNNERQVAPTEMEVPGQTFIVDENGNAKSVDVPRPRALTTDEVENIVEDYAQAARNAIKAGMDGVEIHAGNGYLIDNFINSNSNKREDKYGGSPEKRATLMLEVVEAVVEVMGPNKVAVRLTPGGRFMGMGDDSPHITFGNIAEQLNQFPLAYLHLVEPRMINFEQDHDFDYGDADIIEMMREKFNGTLILAGGYNAENAEIALQKGRGDAVAFGRSFLANPDLPRRIKEGIKLNEPNYDAFYGGGEEGYIDYPFAPVDSEASKTAA